MPKGYLIAQVRVYNPAEYEKFKRTVDPMVERYGGKFLVKSRDGEQREGSLQGLTVILEFESLAAATRFYESDEYQEARLTRTKYTETSALLVEGL